MHLGEELVVLGLLLLIAFVLGKAGKLIGLPAIPIYMIVGLLASPFTGWFPLSFDSASIEFVAIFGLILLLFTLGLEFDLDEFLGNAPKLLLSGGSYILVNMGVGFVFGYLVGWGTREALIIAGITATSSSAIVTKLLIELKRLPNRETPMILGVTVVEDIFIAIYLAIVGVVLSGETEILPVIGKLAVAFTFLLVMFALARWGGAFVSRLVHSKDDELFTILFFGLAVLFGGIGELLGVTDAIGAFLIGLVLGATRYRKRIEALSLPLRDVFGAFFFLNFGLVLDITTFGAVLIPVLVAIVMTIVLNIIAGQFVAWLNGLGAQAGINATVILQNRGEFALILATLSLSAGLDSRIVPFAGLYVLVMAVIGPILASRSEQIGAFILRPAAKPAHPTGRDAARAEAIALVEAAMSGPDARSVTRARVVEPDEADAAAAAAAIDADSVADRAAARATDRTGRAADGARRAADSTGHAADGTDGAPDNAAGPDTAAEHLEQPLGDRPLRSRDELVAEQAARQSDVPPSRQHDPEY